MDFLESEENPSIKSSPSFTSEAQENVSLAARSNPAFNLHCEEEKRQLLDVSCAPVKPLINIAASTTENQHKVDDVSMKYKLCWDEAEVSDLILLLNH
jgi:hypothetical protein